MAERTKKRGGQQGGEQAGFPEGQSPQVSIQGDVLAENVVDENPKSISVILYKMFGNPQTVELTEPACVRDVLRMCKLESELSREWKIEVDGNDAGLDSPVTDGSTVLITQKIDGGEGGKVHLVMHVKIKFV